MNVRMKRAYSYPVEGKGGVYRTLPAGWVGEVEDAIGKAAVKAGAAVTETEADKPKADPKPKAP